MAHLRVISIPIEHLVAEMAAFPLASVTALELSVTRLDPILAPVQSQANPDTRTLWRRAEQQLVRGAPGLSLDELVAIRDRLWFRKDASHHEPKPTPLASYLRNLAAAQLRVRGPYATPALEFNSTYGEADSDVATAARAREAWRWLTFALPPDLLLAVLPVAGESPGEVDALSPQLQLALQAHGFAESHMHLGAGLDFRLLWVALLCGLGDHAFTPDALASPDAVLDEGRRLAPWLLRASIVRYLLAAFLFHDSIAEFKASLAAFLADKLSHELFDALGLSAVLTLQQTIDLFSIGAEDSTAFADLQSVYRELMGACPGRLGRCVAPDYIGEPKSPVDLESAQLADPISALWPPRGSQTPEMRFVAAGLRYLETRPGSERASDELFARLFWQTVRLRNLFYRHVVQRPMTPGLQWFIRTFSRLSRPRGAIDTCLLIESAAASCGVDRGLRSLEVRTSPMENESDLLRFLDDADRHFQQLWRRRAARTQTRRTARHRVRPETPECANEPDTEFGIVFHLAKRREGGAEKGTPNALWAETNVDPSPIPAPHSPSSAARNPSGYRYGSYYSNTRRSVQALSRVFLNYPLSLAIVRGIDACTDELAVPSWVLAPLFRYLRDVSHAASAWLAAHHRVVIPPLRTTVHAGEDFIHLIGGLRRIDESIRYFQLAEGDRLGHCVALGIDAARWAESAGRIAIMREERLWDLVWEWSRYAHDQVPSHGNRCAFVEREVARLSHEIFGSALTPFELEILGDLLHDENALGNAGFPDGSTGPTLPVSLEIHSPKAIRRSFRLLRLLLRDPNVFRRGRSIEWVDPRSEVEAILALQANLRTRIGSLGLTVEVNPSSNLLIGNLGDLLSHPLWRLDPPSGRGDAPPVPICIGSDDPLTFATNLREEYMLLHDALILAGHSYAETDAWLARVREAGLRSRFTMPRPNFDSIRDLTGAVDETTIRPLL